MKVEKRLKRLLKYVRIALISGLIFITGLFAMVYFGFLGDIPSKDELIAIDNYNASEVYTADGQLIGKYFIENRTNVEYGEIPPHLIHALVATEDARFYKHGGIDLKSLLRVFFKSILLGDRSSGGGSTISQQLAKNLYPRKAYLLFSMPVNKLREGIIAYRLEQAYNKEQILTLYLNTVSFGEDIYGIEVAAGRFFDKMVDKLTIEEAAVLVGMLKGTTYYSPRLHPDRSEERRNLVLGQMVKYEFLEQAVADSLMEIPLKTSYRKMSSNTGTATYFREYLRGELQKWLGQKNKEEGTSYNLYKDGLKIYTTIDSKLQQYAEKAVGKHMQKLQEQFFEHWKGRPLWKGNENVVEHIKRNSEKYQKLKQRGLSEGEIEKIFTTPVKRTLFSWKEPVEKEISPLDSIKYYLQFLHAGFMAMEPGTGHIKAWVGGIDYRFFKYDHVTSKRQVGSTFKPVVYAAALEKGIDPCEYISNERKIYEDYEGWSPRNSHEHYEGYYSMQGGLMHSVNTVAVNLMMQTGIDTVRQLAQEMGITSELPAVPSIALGTADIPLREMLSAYAVFPNRGTRVQPAYLLRIEDSEGNILKELEEIEKIPVISRTTADMMNYMLKSVVDSGTASSIRTRYGITAEVAGKTGTTQSQADGWFIGYTPGLVAGAWVGGDYPLTRFRSIRLGQGASMALPVWGDFVKQLSRDPVYSKQYLTDFTPPDIFALEQLNCAPYVDELPKESFWDWLFVANEKWKTPKMDTVGPIKKPEEKNLIDIVRGIFKKK